MKKILLISLLIFSVILVGCEEKSPEKTVVDSGEKTVESLDIVNNVDETTTTSLQDEIINKIEKEMNEYAPNYYNDEYPYIKTKDIIDIDGDGKEEFIFVVNPYGEAMGFRVFSSDGVEIKDGLDEIIEIVYRLELRKSDDHNVLYVHTGYGDGLCYDSNNAYELNLVDNKFEVKKIANYSCDSDEEDRKRALIDTTLPMEEQMILEGEAHTLKYEGLGEVITEEEYNNLISTYESEHELIKKIK